MATEITARLREWMCDWSFLTKEKREQLLKECPLVEAAEPLAWMRKFTRTKDEQDPLNPYKRFPNWPYFDALHAAWEAEPVLFVEKSRTMLLTWWGAGECCHFVMTHQPAVALFWAQDERRALKPLDYAWTLWEQQEPTLKAEFPLKRPRERQAHNQLEWAEGGKLLALTAGAENPDKIRSEHPTILFMDEACFIENGAEALDIALASKVPKVLVVSSAAPSWFRKHTKKAVSAPWEYQLARS